MPKTIKMPKTADHKTTDHKSNDHKTIAHKSNGHKTTDHKKSESKMLTGMFDRDGAERSYHTLSKRGYSKDEINVIMSHDTKEKHYSNEVVETVIGNKSEKGAKTGTVIGGVVGTAVGIIAAIGTSLLLPGLGLIIAGPILVGLAGAGAGGIAGGIIGGLVGLGIPEHKAKVYEKGIKDGKIVIGVHPRNEEDAKHLEKDWHANNGEEINR